MESTLLEIVELSNGDIVLQRADGEGAPLINIRFSDKSKNYVPDMKLEVAKAMIQAGIHAFSELAAVQAETIHLDDEDADRTLH